jgi:uncharacterized damage-inducible protein DinB
MSFQSLIDEYAAGVDLLREAVQGMTPEQLRATPVPGKWSTQQVICHIVDFEPIYADRIKRVIVEDEPLLMSGDPDRFAAGLCYSERDVEVELALAAAVRAQLVTILRSHPESIAQRVGRHNEDGPVTLETLLKRITGHIPHHVKFIREKRAAMGI